MRQQLKIKVWENLQLLTLAGSIGGQIIVGASFLVAQSVWLAANVLALVRDFVLHRPIADKLKNATLTAITLGLIVAYLLGAYN